MVSNDFSSLHVKFSFSVLYLVFRLSSDRETLALSLSYFFNDDFGLIFHSELHIWQPQSYCDKQFL